MSKFEDTEKAVEGEPKGLYFHAYYYGLRDNVGGIYGKQRENLRNFCVSLAQDMDRNPNKVRPSVFWEETPDGMKGRWKVGSSDKDVLDIVMAWLVHMDTTLFNDSLKRRVGNTVVTDALSFQEIQAMRAKDAKIIHAN